MTNAARKLLEDALNLPTSEGARVAAALRSSLEEGDADASSAWSVEIERRADRVLAGESQGAAWIDVRARLLARLRAL